MNVRDVTPKKVSDNTEINNLVKIMGLKFMTGKKNKEDTLKDLRYGRIMIFTDADVDGSHIKGLLMNLFAIFWPELLEIPGFIISLATPILKAIKNKESKEFYTMTEFNKNLFRKSFIYNIIILIIIPKIDFKINIFL